MFYLLIIPPCFPLIMILLMLILIIFLLFLGSCVERAMYSVETIGPAVANGGFTTFLALVLLAASTSHTFLTFFKAGPSS